MGSDRRKYQDKSKAKVSVKLYEQLGITKLDAYNFYIHYNALKVTGASAIEIMAILKAGYGDRFIYYFTILSLELLNKEITKGLV
jgi:hypothetical protein